MSSRTAISIYAMKRWIALTLTERISKPDLGQVLVERLRLAQARKDAQPVPPVQDQHRRSGHSLHPPETRSGEIQRQERASAPDRSRMARFYRRVRQDLAYTHHAKVAF